VPAVFACAGTVCSPPLKDSAHLVEQVHAFAAAHLSP
jgi:hypothetical protein